MTRHDARLVGVTPCKIARLAIMRRNGTRAKELVDESSKGRGGVELVGIPLWMKHGVSWKRLQIGGDMRTTSVKTFPPRGTRKGAIVLCPRCELEMKSNQMEPNDTSSLLRNGKWLESYLKEWKLCIKNGFVGILLEWQERVVADTFIIFAPMRHVRTAKRNGDSVQPTRRWIIPGHAVSLNVEGQVSSVGEIPNVRPSQFLQILQGAHGLMEAPRLWYPVARSV